MNMASAALRSIAVRKLGLSHQAKSTIKAEAAPMDRKTSQTALPVEAFLLKADRLIRREE
jgi:hypothetical protein